MQKKALDLFSGTHSVGKKLQEMGYQVVSVDINKRSRPDFPVDIMQWEYWKVFAPGHFDLVAASVPCNEYSQAKKVGIRDMESADKLVKKHWKLLNICAHKNGGLKILEMDICVPVEFWTNTPMLIWTIVN